MRLFVQRWSDMAGKTSKAPAAAAADDLNADGTALGVSPSDVDLNADGTDVVTASSEKTAGSGDTDGDVSDDDENAAEESPEYIVLKGNSVRHDGETYRENTAIPVTGKDAERLLLAGIIADVNVLRRRVLSMAPAVSVTSE